MSGGNLFSGDCAGQNTFEKQPETLNHQGRLGTVLETMLGDVAEQRYA